MPCLLVTTKFWKCAKWGWNFLTINPMLPIKRTPTFIWSWSHFNNVHDLESNVPCSTCNPAIRTLCEMVSKMFAMHMWHLCSISIMNLVYWALQLVEKWMKPILNKISRHSKIQKHFWNPNTIYIYPCWRRDENLKPWVLITSFWGIQLKIHHLKFCLHVAGDLLKIYKQRKISFDELKDMS